MREVGASQPLTVTCWHSKNTKDNRPVRFAVGPHRVATSTDDRLAQLIDLDDSGRIARTRKMNRVVSSALIDQAESYGREVWVFDDDGDLNSIRRVQTNYRKEQDWICNWQLVLRKLNWERGTVGAPILLPWPSDRQRHENCYVVDFLFEESRLYVLMSTSIGKTGSNEIVVYQVNSENATVLDSASFHSQARYISGFDSIWGTRSINTPPRRLGVRGEGLDFLFWFDPNTPVAKLQSAIGSPAFDNVIEYFPRCDRSGLKVIQNNWIPIDQRRWSCDSDGVIGRVHASPLANLFRSEYLRLSSAGPNRWVELHLRQAIVYDLTDPAHPQRIGHITAPFCLEGTVSGDFLVMAHGPGFSVARLPSIEKH